MAHALTRPDLAASPVRRALLSVYDKTGLVELGRGLGKLGVQLLASGGTAGALAAAGLLVTPIEQFTGAPDADPVAASGGVLAFNRSLDEEAALALRNRKLFVECIIAPGFADAAIAVLRDRVNLRLVQAPPGSPLPGWVSHRIGGGLLVQTSDPGPYAEQTALSLMTKRALAPGWEAELRFALHAAAALKSNAIAVSREQCPVGAGTGQVSRVEAVAQALPKAGERTRGAFLGSDAFFPFPDCVRLAQTAGIVAIIQPGGSVRDAESIAACDELGLAMVFTGRRHFRH